MVNWDAIGAVGEVVGALTVIVTLLYLAKQIKQNSAAVKIAAAQALLSEANGTLRVASSNPQTARAVILGQTCINQLSEEERAQFIVWIFSWMRTIEQAYFQYLRGNIEEEIWEGQEVHLQQVAHAPAVITWWSMRRDYFSKSFQNYVDELASRECSAPTPTQVVESVGVE